MTVFEDACEMCARTHCLKVIYQDTYYCAHCIKSAIAFDKWWRSSTVVDEKLRVLGELHPDVRERGRERFTI